MGRKLFFLVCCDELIPYEIGVDMLRTVYLDMIDF